jgi:hypothetical protein
MLLPNAIHADLVAQLQSLSSRSELDNALQNAGAPELEKLVGNVGFDEQVVVVLRYLAKNAGHLRDVLKRLAAEHTAEPDFLKLVERASAHLKVVAPEEDHLMLVSRAGGQLFANRSQVRSTVVELADSNGPRVLALDGEEGSGKSHCWYFVDLLRWVKGVEPILLDLDDYGLDEEIAAADLAGDVLSALGLDTSGLVDDGTVLAPRRAKDLWRLLEERLKGSRKPDDPPVWVFLDHASKVTLSAQATDLVELMAKKAVLNVVPGLRLIVVGKRETFDLPSSARLVELQRLNATNLVELFTTELAEPRPPPSELDAVAREVLSSNVVDLQEALKHALVKLREGAKG